MVETPEPDKRRRELTTYDADGNATDDETAYSRAAVTEDGRVTTVLEYVDADGNPTPIASASHAEQTDYDEQGNVTTTVPASSTRMTARHTTRTTNRAATEFGCLGQTSAIALATAGTGNRKPPRSPHRYCHRCASAVNRDSSLSLGLLTL
jgi:YD repeat-containing protein